MACRSKAAKTLQNTHANSKRLNFKLESLRSDTALPEPYLIYRYLAGLGDAYPIFVTAYLLSHNLFGDNKVSFTQVSLAARTEEQLIRFQQEDSAWPCLRGITATALAPAEVEAKAEIGAKAEIPSVLHLCPPDMHQPTRAKRLSKGGQNGGNACGGCHAAFNKEC